MDTRRSFIKKASLLSAGTGLMGMLPPAIQKAMAINPAEGSTYLDAEHIVFLMQENRSFDHTYGCLQGVRGYNDPRAIELPNKNKVWLQSDEKGNTYAPFRLNLMGSKATWMSSLPHSWANQVDARNNGRYDKWLGSKHSWGYPEMPLTLGYYNRQDIPFYYALADAFTVCDQNFCSSLTGTTPNRLFFWSGTIRNKQEAAAKACVWNEDADPDTYVDWKTFPERLEENDISWKMYQNELYLDVGFEGEEEGWLSNFGDNAIEYFKQYNVKLSAAFIANLPKAKTKLEAAIKKAEEELIQKAGDAKEAGKIENRIKGLKKRLDINIADQQYYTKERYDSLPQFQKNLHDKAFTTNIGDPYYHQLAMLEYDDNGIKRQMHVPKGDVLHQFRQDVKNGQLPTVSWVTAPENFSDHPSAAWYGAWYISEVLDILTQNPKVWKKTIFVLTYDENDGYFDHVPPFTAPNPLDASTGRCSGEIDTGVDFVQKEQQTNYDNRVSPIGLGYRVPLVIASPWSRGGWVNSQVFDHTSSLQFLEHFLSNKTNQKIEETNISQWRRTVCGNLSSAFRPYNGEKIALPTPVKRDAYVEDIHKAQFKGLPDDFKKLSAAEIALANTQPRKAAFMPKQEKGTRPACALPYELYADGQLSADKKSFELKLNAGNGFGKKAAGSPFNVYAPGKYNGEAVRTWAYAVQAGDSLAEQYPLQAFENGRYHLRVYGPNGFYREFAGTANEAAVEVRLTYQKTAGKLTGNVLVQIKNNSGKKQTIQVADGSYGTATQQQQLAAGGSASLLINTAKTKGWYDCIVTVMGDADYRKQYAGRVETGQASITDPAMA